HLSRLFRATARPAVTASASEAAPTTSMVIILLAPSASSWSWRARSAHTSVIAWVNSVSSGLTPAPPLAISRTVSLVDMQPAAAHLAEVARGARAHRRPALGGAGVAAGGDPAPQGRHPGGDHPRPLGHPADRIPVGAPEGDLHDRVGGPDRVGGGQAAGPGGFGHGGVDAGEELVHGETLADQPGGADCHFPCARIFTTAADRAAPLLPPRPP